MLDLSIVGDRRQNEIHRAHRFDLTDKATVTSIHFEETERYVDEILFTTLCVNPYFSYPRVDWRRECLTRRRISSHVVRNIIDRHDIHDTLALSKAQRYVVAKWVSVTFTTKNNMTHKPWWGSWACSCTCSSMLANVVAIVGKCRVCIQGRVGIQMHFVRFPLSAPTTDTG